MSFLVRPPKSTYCRLAQLFLALASNALEVYNIPPPSKNKEEPPEAVRSFSVDLPGHRTDIRTLSLSADDQILASASSGRHLSRPFHCLSNTHRITENLEHEDYCMYSNHGLRICNLQHILTRGSPRQSLTFCISTCRKLLFQIAIGTKSGEILIYDISSSSLIETIKAHSSTVWSLNVRADQCALVSGSEDKNVKFWEFEQKDGTGENVCPFYFSEASV